MLAASVLAFAQTKRIAHRSHSGSNSGFQLDAEGNFGDIGPWYGNMTKKEIDSIIRSDSILNRWTDSIYRLEAAGKVHAQASPPPKPQPGKGAAAGAAAATGITRK